DRGAAATSAPAQARAVLTATTATFALARVREFSACRRIFRFIATSSLNPRSAQPLPASGTSRLLSCSLGPTLPGAAGSTKYRDAVRQSAEPILPFRAGRPSRPRVPQAPDFPRRREILPERVPLGVLAGAHAANERRR